MLDLLGSVTHSSSFILKMQQKEVSNKIDRIVRESDDFNERLSYKHFFSQLSKVPFDERIGYINRFLTD